MLNDHFPDCVGPERQFRGVYCPAELFDLVEDGTITTEIAFLALTIDSLVNAKGEGCWASKSFLAKKLNKKLRQIQRDIRILEGYREESGEWIWKGPRLIRQVGWKTIRGKRYRILETKWSRVDLDEQNDRESEMSPVLKDRESWMTPLGESSMTLSPRVMDDSQRSNGSNSKIEKGKRIFGENLPNLSQTKGFPGMEVHRSFGDDLAKLVYKELKKAKKIYSEKQVNLRSWAKDFNQHLLQVMKVKNLTREGAEAKLRADLIDHLEHIEDPYQPKLYAARTICEQYVKIEDAKKRRESGNGRPRRHEAGKPSYTYEEEVIS